MIYTLIAFSMIALVLAYAKPKIEEAQDKSILEQSISMLEEVDGIMLSIIQGGQGNVRVPKLLIKKGSLIIDGENDKISFEMESKYMYSELDETVQIGGMVAKTTKIGKYYNVRITKYYPELNIKYMDEDTLKNMNKASTKQSLLIENNGEDISWGGQCEIILSTACNDATVPEGTILVGCSYGNPEDIDETYCKYKSEKITVNMEVK